MTGDGVALPEGFDGRIRHEGSAISIAPLEDGDREGLARAASDPAIWEMHPDKSRTSPDGFARWWAGATGPLVETLTFRDPDGEIVGSSRFYRLEGEAPVSIGFTFLVRRLWGGPANREVKRVMIDRALTAEDAVHFHIGVHNLRSQRAVAKLGAVHLHDMAIAASDAPHQLWRLDGSVWRGGT